MGEVQLIQQVILKFARQRLSSTAQILHLQDQGGAGVWIAWVACGGDVPQQVVARHRNRQWEVELYSGMLAAMEDQEAAPAPRSTQVRPAPVPVAPRNVRWCLDQRYEAGQISYQEYVRRLRLIGER